MSGTLVQEVEWNTRLEALLKQLDPLLGVETLKRLQGERRIFTHEVIHGEKSLGFYIGRVDVLANGDRELVIMHAVSEVKGPKPLAHILSGIFPGVGLQLKCKRVRIHSETRKMDNLLESSGYQFTESVFTKEI